MTIKKTIQKSLSFIILLIIMVSCMVCTIYAEDNVNTINKIAFIDEGVENYNTLVKIISEKMPVYVIKNDSDGILQITNILSDYDSLDSIAIYSKGMSGGIKLGTSFINTHNIDRYKEYMQSWSNSITPTADILLYACNTAKSGEGKQFINQISEITGADVAASTNYTGTYGENTDWELEYCAGSVESGKDFDTKGMYKYRAKLDGTTRIWDGEGEDEYGEPNRDWSCAKNWSGDKIPDATDIVIFDSTSIKDVNVDGEYAVYDLIIKEGYTGFIYGNNLTITNDLEMNGGNIGLYRLNVNGATNITKGSIACNFLYTYGDVNISGLENPIDSEIHICKDKKEDTATTISGDFEVNSISFDDSNHDYQVNGCISINKGQDSPNRLEFNNNGNISINDGAKIDVSKCECYYNSYDHRYDYNYHNYGNITENGTGRLYFDANDFYFCDSNGYPVIQSAVGEKIFISLIDFDSNLDKNKKDTVTVIVKRESDLNDTVTLTLTETENDSSLFRNFAGLELVATDSIPLEGQLKYDGSENLIAEYTDSNSPEDTVSCKMDRDPIIWDGEGKEDYGNPIYDWNCDKNWSTDTAPKMYDIVLFNDTSCKNAFQSREYEISKIVVDVGYEGEIKFDRSYDPEHFITKVFNDVVVNDGTITLNSHMTINGDLDIQDGTFNNELNSSNNVINGNLNLSGGEFKFSGDILEIKNGLNINGGKFNFLRDYLNLKGNVDISGGTIYIKKAIIKDSGNKITINNIDEKIVDELVIEENTEFNGNMSVGSLALNPNKTLDINGIFTCYDAFINNGTINVADGSTLDFKNVMTYENNIINDNDTGKILYNSGGIGFVNKDGDPIGTAKVGDEIYVEVIDLSNNKNVHVKDTVTVTVSSQETGDYETISLTETDINTSVFRSEVGLELIGTDSEPIEGQLKFNGSEDLEAVYVDARDEDDTVSCNLYKKPIIWDGDGDDNNWTTPENWSTDTVPTSYDSITLNDTSTKDINIDNNIEMYKFNVEESYTGEITGIENASFYSASDVTIAGGTINISGRFQTGGNLTVSGGSIDIQYDDNTKYNIIGGNLLVSDGEVLAKGYFDVKGNMLISGGSFKPSYEGAETNIYSYGDVDLLVKTEIGRLYVYGNHLNCSTDKENLFLSIIINKDGNVEITGSLKTKYFNNDFKATTDILGKETIMTIDNQGIVNNYNVLNIKDGAIFNASNYDYNNSWNPFCNFGQINEINGGKFYCDTKDMYFTNASGDRIVFANVGDAVFVKLFDANINKNGSKNEEVVVTVESSITGDSEDITLTETTFDSGIFTNSDGLLLVADDSAHNDGKLKYNGTEDLEASYTDITDPEDNYTCNLFRSALVWDGGGKDNSWNTAENWSEDRIPDEYDNIVFNGTSDKRAESTSEIPKISSMTIEESYKGIVKVNNTLNVEEDVTVNGGKLEIGDSWRNLTIKANGLILGGGIIEDKSYEEDIFNNLIITGGELKPYNIMVKSNFNMTGGKIRNNCGQLKLYGDAILTNAEKFDIDRLDIYGKITLTNAEEFHCNRLNIYGSNINVAGDNFSTNFIYIYTNGDVDLNGNINISGDYSNGFEIGSNSTLNLNGKIEFCLESSNGLNNFGTLNLNDNSILDLRKASKFVNLGTITISDTAKLYYNAEAMGVIDEYGAPALKDFNFGEDLLVLLIDKNRNLNNSIADNVEINLINWTNGDDEKYTLVETGVGTYEFRGAGFTTSVSDTATKGNNIFEGQDSDAFQITYTDIMSGIVEYVVSKNCAELDIEGIDDLIANGIDYGNVDINGNTNTYTITLQNRGDIPLGIQEISLDNTDDFSFSEEPDISDMDPDSSRDINIDFKPTGFGEKTTNLIIKTNDKDEGVIIIPLKGTGVEPPVSFGIDDITLLQGTESYEINVFEIFEDAQDNDEDLEFSIVNNYGSLIIGTVIDKAKGTLILQLNTCQSGDEFITLRATDTSNAYVDEQFRLMISECHTILGKVVDSEGNAIEGATVKIIDAWDNEKCYTTATSSDGTFSVSFPACEINTPRKIRISKDSLKYNSESHEWGDVNLGTITLAVETDVEKAQRLANDLTVKCLGLQNGDQEYSVTNNLLLSDTAGEGSIIEWSSSNLDVISNSGLVTRPAIGHDDVEVVMTATVKVNDVTAQKEFFVIVRGLEANIISIDSDDTHIYIEESKCQKPITINIIRKGDLEETVSVDYETIDDFAEAGTDYIYSKGTLTFLSGEKKKTVSLYIKDDDLLEGPEYFKLVLSNPTGNIIIDESESEIEIEDDDPMPNYEIFYISDIRYYAMEKESLAIEIERMNGSDDTVSIDYITKDITAKSGCDYIAKSGTLQFAPGEDNKEITIDILDDNIYEDEESFNIILSNVTGEAKIVIPKTKIIIEDNDSFGMEQPSVPILQSAAYGDGHVELTWTAETDATQYMIYKSTISGFYELPLTIVDSSVNSYDITGLDNGTTYYFMVRASYPNGDSENSNEISATPRDESEEPKTVPSEPTNVSATAGNGQAQVSFTAPVDNGGSEITRYIVASDPENITATGTGTTITVKGLTNGTTYTFTVKAENEVGFSQSSAISNAVTPHKSSSGTSNKHTKPIDNGVNILVNGKTENAATSITTKVEDKTVTTVTVDDKKVEEKLQSENNNAVVTIPVINDSDVVVGQLSGQTVKNMGTKEAVLEIKTENVTYTLPASQINIDNVSSEIGNQVELADIVVNVKVAEPSQDTVKIVEDTADKNNYQIIVKPIEFEISCSSDNKTVKVSKFNAYVERTIAIPDGVDASKITTGIVLNPDGTFSHVPTTITIIDGKYYAKINSLTNSAYSVIFSPKSFKDVANHWAKDSINDMGSRLVINGVGDGYYEPDRDITRAEFATIVVKALGLMRNGTGNDVFSDVTKNEWYYDAVSIAYEYGIISGYDNGKFGPMEKITREQAMTIIARAMEITKLKVEIQDGEIDKLFEEFNDFEKSANWAKNSIASCIKAGIVNGRNGQLIAPKDNIKRAEVAVIVRRLLKNSKLI
ncbi:DUF4347 domain-containing protein [Abyssisolibacter fermentans]|uniref:DUF4347 domain-containing protein n=1 Tax=Abyssisolibacter fermentans TaxID=1766203 RepID=UPI00082A3B62|nr:DUF4347 domain-containing protein [Abyssisolibacter fermentans]